MTGERKAEKKSQQGKHRAFFSGCPLENTGTTFSMPTSWGSPWLLCSLGRARCFWNLVGEGELGLAAILLMDRQAGFYTEPILFMITSSELGIYLFIYVFVCLFMYCRESSFKKNTEVFATFLCQFRNSNMQSVGKCYDFLVDIVKPPWEPLPLLDYDYSVGLGKRVP